MGRRLDFHAVLKTITSNVYFQEPPPNVGMQYPCIVYDRDAANTRFAGNSPYRYTQRYMVTIIEEEPDSTLLDAVAALPQSAFNRHYAANNLNHDVFVIYF